MRIFLYLFWPLELPIEAAESDPIKALPSGGIPERKEVKAMTKDTKQTEKPECKETPVKPDSRTSCGCGCTPPWKKQ